MWRKDITSKITVIDTGSNRVCAVLINIAANLNLLCLNVYLPYESSAINTDEFQFQLAIIADIIEQHPSSEVLLGGDFNVDFSRNWTHTSLLNNFCERELLFPLVKGTLHSKSTLEFL